MSRRQLAAWALAGGAVVVPLSIARARRDEPEPPAHRVLVRQKEAPLGDVSQILKIRTECGTFEATSDITNVTLVIAFYKDGQQDAKHALKLHHNAGGAAFRKGAYSIQIADLDYLPLTGGNLSECRIDAEFKIETKTFKSTTHEVLDLPKKVLDFEKNVSSTRFSRNDEGQPEDEVVLFMMHTRSDRHGFGETVAEIVENNPEGDLMIAYLRCNQKEDDE